MLSPHVIAQSNEFDANSQSGNHLELIIGESMRLSDVGVKRFLIGDPELLEVARVGVSGLEVTAKGVGRTFLHVWSDGGRSTYIVKSLPLHYRQLERERVIERAIEYVEAMKFGYETTFESVRRGPSFSRTDESTTTRMRHALNASLETPYGFSSSYVAFNRVNNFSDLTTWSSRLDDGHIGPFEDFTAIAGDASIPFGGTTFASPSLGYRGATYLSKQHAPWKFSTLWGRERFGAFIPFTSGSSTDRDSFIYGFHFDYDEPGSFMKFGSSAMFGYGDEHLSTQSSSVFDFYNTVELAEPLTFESEFAFSEGAIGYRLGPSYQDEDFRISAKFRTADKDFHTIAGSSAFQGETGLNVSANWRPTAKLSLQGSSDVFRDRLFANPIEPDTLNVDVNLSGDWNVRDGTFVSGFVTRRRNRGLLFPRDDFRLGSSIFHQLPMQFIIPNMRPLGLSLRLEHQKSENTNTPSLDFDRETATAGISMPLPWRFSARLSHQWNFLEETSTGLRSQPRRLTAGISHFSNWADGKWNLRARFGYEDESRTQSTRSFLAGQDRLVWETGLRYQPTPSTEAFVDGRIENVKFSSGLQNQIEFTVFTGARFLFDTQVVRWNPAGHIQGFVFHDLNGDGKIQPGEEGLDQVKVFAGLTNETTTDYRGRFMFPRIAGKAIPVSLDVATLPQGFVISTPAIQVLRPENRPWNIIFGALGRAEVRGRVFYDVDGDGAYSGADRGVEGIRLTLDSRSAVTDRSGWFFFRDLPGGNYTVSLDLETLPLQYLPLGSVRRPLEMQEGAITTIDFPVFVERRLKGRVYLDANRNSQFDIGERTFENIPVCMDGRRVATTDTQGVYTFNEIGLGRHTLILNCGMPMGEFIPFSNPKPSINVNVQDPTVITVDYRMESESAVREDVLRERKARNLTVPVIEL